MKETRHETASFQWRKTVKKLDMLATGDQVLWQPPTGRDFVLTGAWVRVRKHTGTNVIVPEIVLDDSTDDENIVDQVELGSQVEGNVQALDVSQAFVFNNENPLRLSVEVAATGSTAYDVDLILVAIDLGPIQS